MPRLKFIPLLLLGILIPAFASPAQASDQLIQVEVAYVFADQLVFEVRFEGQGEVSQAMIYIRVPELKRDLYGELVQLNGNGSASRYEFIQDLAQNPIPPFSTIEYWVELTMRDGSKYSTEVESLLYVDNDREWQNIANGNFSVYWSEGGTDLGLQVMEVAKGAIDAIREMTGFSPPQNLEIYVYPDSGTLAEIYDPSGSRLPAGHARPSDGIVLVALPDGPDAERMIRQRIPHEIFHVMLFQSTGLDYQRIPVWFNEGLATMFEQYPDPDDEVLLRESFESGNLIPMETLCASFPTEATSTLLAYAQSASFTRYLLQRYGASGIQSLLAEYANGKSCQYGFEDALGKPLTEVEADWRQGVFGEAEQAVGFDSLLPWMFLVCAVLLVPLFLAVRMIMKPS